MLFYEFVAVGQASIGDCKSAEPEKKLRLLKSPSVFYIVNVGLSAYGAPGLFLCNKLGPFDPSLTN